MIACTQYLRLGSVQIPAFINGAVTPVTSSNPLYSLYEYQTTDGSISSFRQRYFNLSVLPNNPGQWADLVVNSTAAPMSLTSPITSQSILAFITNDLAKNASLSVFEWYYGVSVGDGPELLPCGNVSTCQIAMTCGMTFNSDTDVQNCIAMAGVLGEWQKKKSIW